MLISRNLHKKSSDVSIETRSNLQIPAYFSARRRHIVFIKQNWWGRWRRERNYIFLFPLPSTSSLSPDENNIPSKELNLSPYARIPQTTTNSVIIHTSSCPYSTLKTRGHKGHGLVALLLLGGEERTSKFVMLLAFCAKRNRKPIIQCVFKISRWNKTTEHHLRSAQRHTTEKPVSMHENLVSSW